MPAAIDWTRWTLFRDTIESCLQDGFQPPNQTGGKGSAAEEAQRRLRAQGALHKGNGALAQWVRVQEQRALAGKDNRLPNWTLFRRQHAFPQPAAPEAAPPLPPTSNLTHEVKAALARQPRTVDELVASTNTTIGAVLDALDQLSAEGVNVRRRGDHIEIPRDVEPSWTRNGAALEIVSRRDNTFCFGAMGDLHAASKYCRWDVREDLVRRVERAGAQAIFDTGNWIDGEARFNKYDLEVHGFDRQIRHLAEMHPRTTLPIHAVWGDDHEGWYVQREGIDVGTYAEAVMREAGHDWSNLGFMEAHVRLVNANTGAAATLAVVHPGGGSAYALSYSIQKIVESYEGGEKPAVALYGHYHKLWSGLIRNVWVVQTGTAQDQTPFMRKKRLEAHVGGAIVTLEQDPESGAILSMKPELIRYFNRGFYEGSGRWSSHGPVVKPERAVMGVAR